MAELTNLAGLSAWPEGSRVVVEGTSPPRRPAHPADEPATARCETGASRYAILHRVGKLTRAARQVRLHLDRTWAWAEALERAFCRLRAAFLT